MLRLFMLLIVFSFAACASSNSVVRDPEKTNEVIITFVTKAKAGFWREAMDCITPDERDDMVKGGKIKQEYIEAISRIRLSSIKNMDIGLDGKGRLVGLKKIFTESSESYRAANKVGVKKVKIQEEDDDDEEDDDEEEIFYVDDDE